MSADNDPATKPPEGAAQVETELPEDLETGFLDRRIGDRPLIVYLAMLAGLGVLLLLLGIVWASATGGGKADQPICLDITREEAEERILAGEVKELDVLADQGQPLEGLTLIQMTFDNDECAKLPEGADNREALYEVLGVVTHSNETTSDRIEINYTYKDVPVELLSTSTAIPSATMPPTSTVAGSPAPTLTQVETATEEPTAPATASAAASATPRASPAS